MAKSVWMIVLSAVCLGLLSCGRKTEAPEEATLPEFQETYSHVEEARRQAAPYDIEQTVKVMNAVELAQQTSGSLDEFLTAFAQLNLAMVAPEVLKGEQALLDILQEMRRLELENSQWKCASLFLSGLHVAQQTSQSVEAGEVVSGAVAMVSREMAVNAFVEIERYACALADVRKQYEERVEILKQMYLQYLSSYLPVYEKYCKEWDALCLKKDKAYLDIYGERFDSAYRITGEILAQYPENRETLLLHALSLTMMGMGALKGEALQQVPLVCMDSQAEASLPEGWSGDDCLEKASQVLKKYLAVYPGYSAPALVLQGLVALCRGEEGEGLTLLGQASIEYPRQAARLLEMFDLYKSRAYLTQSVEGGYLLRLYRSTMEGYGIFSPNLIKAGYHAQRHEDEASRREIFNHFFRRGNQVNFECLLSDMQFCDKFMDNCFRKMLPESSFMDLAVSHALFDKNKLNVSIDNRSNVALQNVRVFLCLHLTDMYTDEYAIVKLPTKNQLLPMQKTDFEAVKLDLNGKGYNDIAHVRAIVMTDDAICWIDEPKYRQERAVAACKRLVAAHQSQKQIDQRLRASGFNQEKLCATLRQRLKPCLFLREQADGLLKNMKSKLADAVAFSPESKWLKSEGKLKCEMPRSIMSLEPVFVLKTPAGQQLLPEVCIANDANILLLFDMKPNKDEPCTLYVYNRYVACKVLMRRQDDEMVIQEVVVK